MKDLYYPNILKVLSESDDYKNNIIVYEIDVFDRERSYRNFENIDSFVDFLNREIEGFICNIKKEGNIYKLQFKMKINNNYENIYIYCILGNTYNLLSITYDKNKEYIIRFSKK